jgi:demethylmenaquinone methyltransferase/2-methoxy-6-polyprenyl-1,4-benzoquinol methylase
MQDDTRKSDQDRQDESESASPANDSAGTTHFGYETVPEAEKVRRVGEVFHSVAQRYDLMNDLMSLGIHRLWKRHTIQRALVRPGQSILDLAGGTGDLAAAFAPRVGPKGRVVVCDINASMLAAGRDRLLDRGLVENLEFVQADAEALPFPDESFHCVSIAFGLRNVTRKERALAEMYRVLKAGGRLLVLEFSRPTAPLRPFYDAYSFHVLPLLGRLVASDSDSYRYLAESIRMHPDQETLADMIRDVGFERVEFENMTGGVVALHRARRL